MPEIFLDSARSKMDFAGVLEVDDDTVYFYLCSIDGFGGSKIIDSINIGGEFCGKSESDFQICWNDREDLLVIIVENKVRGAFQIIADFASDLKYIRMTSSQIDENVKRIFQIQ
jgi:hypothetical protein